MVNKLDFTGKYQYINNLVNTLNDNTYSIISNWDLMGSAVARKFELRGIRTYSWGDNEKLLKEEDFDCMLAVGPKSEVLIKRFNLPVVYIIAAERPGDRPVINENRAIYYTCLSKEIAEFIQAEYKIPPEKIRVIENIKETFTIFDNLDELTIVIPTYNRIDKLQIVLTDLSKIKHVIASKGGTFAQSCNQGFLGVRTKYVCFLNDDVHIENIVVFKNMLAALRRNEFDIVGCQVKDGISGFNFRNDNGIKVLEVCWANIETKYPAGACIMMAAQTYARLGGFNEIFKNGCEDIAFIIEAERQNLKIGKTKDFISHKSGSSEGRYDHVRYNVTLFNKMYPGYIDPYVNVGKD
jgi:hypothetical protein